MKTTYLAAAMLLTVSCASINSARADNPTLVDSQAGRSWVFATDYQGNGYHDDDYNRDPNAAVRWHGRVDDTVTIFFQGNNVWQQTNSGNRLRDGDTRVYCPLPYQGGDVIISNGTGRGNISVVQQPRPWNHFTTEVRICDPQASDSFYRFSLDFRPFDRDHRDDPHTWQDGGGRDNGPAPWRGGDNGGYGGYGPQGNGWNR